MAAAAVLSACAPAVSARPAAAPPGSAPVAAAPRTAAGADRECDLPEGTVLVDVRHGDRSIRTDVRYATANNFTGAVLPGYERPLALLRMDAAEALGRVQRRLRVDGVGLKVYDAYRPIRATQAMVNWAQRTGNQWVLDQGYVAGVSGHNRAATVDLTLVELSTGREVDMGTPYDTFSEAAHTANAMGTVAANRRRLVQAMEAEGFQNYDKEWWHFRMPGDFPPLDAPLRCFGG
ncbi:MAG TPA: M15 family metallopeptidase [Longimicrobium sp.]|uniref:M15 family metallopeptidase n=1 Tax=Longimicrobium sp. TaxID=2029185 RepID=UPI002ED915B0